jgi:hypothetical protein
MGLISRQGVPWPDPGGLTSAITVAEAPLGSDDIPDALLQLFGVRETTFLLAGPEGTVSQANFKNTAATRNEGHAPQFILKRCQEFLRQPGSPEQPAALRTVFDFDAGFAIHGQDFGS